MDAIKTNKTVDAKGLACPMPIVRTKKAMKDIEPGQVMEVQATDKGSKADIEAWAKSAGHQYLGTLEDGEVLHHYLRKSSEEETIEKKHPHTITNEALEASIAEDTVVIDVREPAEYAFNHIAGAVSLPFEELEERMNELNKEDTIYVVCRTGNRSDLAAQKLAQNGFEHVINVVPGMSAWNGGTAALNH
ncbi:UPF0033 protein YrkI [Lentibacillus sp. JNUCC-1]|uniref:sulfurtransferase TusA family protein n=1 Tax=Lentibacillus sp. JNUCC-1 TaxID=2654513 RepID=UPI0012E73E08|nr:sulfurtransferase TusA family protein [Lentibacillus sp. JNUCC-1]MUV37829.1 UPF0033 protein YrkI [Lentibacillus sp. JNUCC-1]